MCGGGSWGLKVRVGVRVIDCVGACVGDALTTAAGLGDMILDPTPPFPAPRPQRHIHAVPPIFAA